MLQDSPQSTAQLLNQVHMMSQVTCPLIHPLHCLLNKVLVLGDVIQSVLVFPVHYPAVLISLQSVLSIIQLPCTRCMLCHPAS